MKEQTRGAEMSGEHFDSGWPSRPNGEASGGRFAGNGLAAKMQTLLTSTDKNSILKL